jgi:hypothetical protein
MNSEIPIIALTAEVWQLMLCSCWNEWLYFKTTTDEKLLYNSH